MDVVGEQVRHQRFGIGEVVNQTKKYVTVEFPEEYGVKQFLYPSGFESFMELCNPVVKERMDGEIRELQELAEAERQQREKEAEIRREKEQLALLEQKNVASTKTRRSTKKTTVDSAVDLKNSER